MDTKFSISEINQTEKNLKERTTVKNVDVKQFCKADSLKFKFQCLKNMSSYKDKRSAKASCAKYLYPFRNLFYLYLKN